MIKVTRSVAVFASIMCFGFGYANAGVPVENNGTNSIAQTIFNNIKNGKIIRYNSITANKDGNNVIFIETGAPASKRHPSAIMVNKIIFPIGEPNDNRIIAIDASSGMKLKSNGLWISKIDFDQLVKTAHGYWIGKGKKTNVALFVDPFCPACRSLIHDLDSDSSWLEKHSIYLIPVGIHGNNPAAVGGYIGKPIINWIAGQESPDASKAEFVVNNNSLMYTAFGGLQLTTPAIVVGNGLGFGMNWKSMKAIIDLHNGNVIRSGESKDERKHHS